MLILYLFSMTPAGSCVSFVETAFSAPVASLNFCTTVQKLARIRTVSVSIKTTVVQHIQHISGVIDPDTLTIVPAVAVTVLLRKLSSCGLFACTAPDEVCKGQPEVRHKMFQAPLLRGSRCRACMVNLLVLCKIVVTDAYSTK